MKRVKALAVIVVVVLLSTAGCGSVNSSVQKSTNVKKGTTVGGLSGGMIGAVAGHSCSLGGLPGGLIGLGVGGVTGALVAETYYPDEPEELDTLEDELQSKESTNAELRQTLKEREAQRQALLEAHDKARKELHQLRAEMSSGKGNVTVTKQDDETLKVTILSDVLFQSGKASLTSEGCKVLSKAARSVRRQYPDAQIEVRGHTDNVPIRHSDWSSNWELSCYRALAVVHHLIEKEDFDSSKLRAVGMADTQPVATNDTTDGRKANRRAEILIRPDAQLASREMDIR